VLARRLGLLPPERHRDPRRPGQLEHLLGAGDLPSGGIRGRPGDRRRLRLVQLLGRDQFPGEELTIARVILLGPLQVSLGFSQLRPGRPERRLGFADPRRRLPPGQGDSGLGPFRLPLGRGKARPPA